jgi:hypothetical protein
MVFKKKKKDHFLFRGSISKIQGNDLCLSHEKHHMLLVDRELTRLLLITGLELCEET